MRRGAPEDAAINPTTIIAIAATINRTGASIVKL
jgi:hypothetical protein